MIINLKTSNKFVHFKMEVAHLLRDQLIKNDWMVKIDLKEEYYTGSHSSRFSEPTQFSLGQQILQIHMPTIRSLLCTNGPYQSVEASSSVLQREGHQIIIYVDNILIMAQLKQIHVAQDHLYLNLDILEILGFLVNYLKSILQPTQIIDFLGVLVNCKEMNLNFSQEKGDDHHQGGHNNIEWTIFNKKNFLLTHIVIQTWD